MMFIFVTFIFLGSLVLPWWWICFPSFIYGYVGEDRSRSVILSFGSVFVVWFASIYLKNAWALGGSAKTLGAMIGVENGFLFIVLVSMFAGLLGGVSSYCGILLKRNKLKRKGSSI